MLETNKYTVIIGKETKHVIIKKKCIAIELNVGILLALKYLECNTIWIMQNKIEKINIAKRATVEICNIWFSPLINARMSIFSLAKTVE